MTALSLLDSSPGQPVWWLWCGLALATLVSEDLACVAGGLLAAAGRLGLAEAVGACFAGIFVGDLLLVAAGRFLGRRVLETWPLRGRITPAAMARGDHWLQRRGPAVILLSRFLPGTRLPTYLAIGVSRLAWRTFVPWFALACALWVPLLVGLASVVGEAAERWLAAWAGVVPGVLLAGLAGWGVMRLGVGLSTWRGRRLLWSRWRRLTAWEFWPMWAVYPPVVVYLLWLGLRHRGLLLFTAANPGIEAAGGLVGESKARILQGLAGAGEVVATWIPVPPGVTDGRVAQVLAFAERNGWPVVLKPDVGERGAGVVIARDAAAVVATLAAPEHRCALIAQAYVPGVEFGVFYVRQPAADRGEIFAITDKRMLAVDGDGQRTLEELILADERAVCMARFFLRAFAERLAEVPARGERVPLTELGTHCRGALFLDGAALWTPALAAEIDRVSRTLPGFYFGRYDVRAESVEAFRAGRFRVIELNGVSSEATSMYDPRHSVWHGWRVLARQWRHAYAIGAANRARGARVWSMGETWDLWRRARRSGA